MAMSCHVLAIGLPPDLVDEIASGLSPARVQPGSADHAIEELEQAEYTLLVIDAKSGLEGLMLLKYVRASPRLRTMPVFYLMDRRTEGAEAITEFIRSLGIEPVGYSEDLQTVVDAVRPALGLGDSGETGPGRDRQPDPEQAGGPKESETVTPDAPAEEAPQGAIPQVQPVEGAVAGLDSVEERGPEKAVEGEAAIGAAASRRELLEGQPLLLVADPSERVTKSLEAEAASRKIRTCVASSLAEAREILSRERPDVAVLDLALPNAGQDGGMAEGGIALLEDLRRRVPPVPALVLTRRDGFGDRAAVVTRGGRGFLQKPMPAAEVLDVVVQMLEPERPYAGKVMVIDNDPIIQKGLEAVLEAAGVLTASIGAETDDLFRIWDYFERFVPDVVVLDHDAPGMRGIDLCRIMRLDPRWAALPIIFLTATRDAETVREVFAAGGDDYVSKGNMSPELFEKIAHWLQRAEWYRTMADVDPLTRLVNRRGGRQVLERFLGAVRRHVGKMAVAVLDVDNFKRINDTIGHAEGDEVLRRVAERLRRTFQRPTDVIVRWGGEEILIGMQDTTKQDAARMLENVLRDLREEPPGGDHEPITFSAGVAQYPTDGGDLYELYLAADRAMYQAKSSGKNRVVMSHEP